jgi:serine/threonine protein kinase
MTDLTGQQFGNYRLLRLLGQGGFAEVYLGQHVHLSSQQAALKILSTLLDGQDTQAFVREAETIAALVHPHIIRVLDFDIQERCPFLVMDYAPHGSLRQRHARGEQVPLSTVVSYAQQIAQGLAYAHEKKIVHRDIKPDNMLIDGQNKIVVSDFGIATIVLNTSTQIAQGVVGTVPYMAPEQFQGQARPASDQYALAICVYEWLTGICPFSGTFTEVAFKHAMSSPPPLREKCPMLPFQVEQVVLAALAKDPKDRFVSVLAFANALTQASQLAYSENITPAFLSARPIQLPLYPSIASNTTMHSSAQTSLQPIQEQSIYAGKRRKRRSGWFVGTMVLLAVLVFVLGGVGIFPLIKNLSAHSPAAPIATPALTSTPMPTVIPVTNVTSVANFTTQSPQLSNLTLVKNDSLFQTDHSILQNNGQVVVAFSSQKNGKTVTLVIRGLVSQISPNQSGFSPINLLCNGQVIVSNYIMPGNGFSPNTTSIQVPDQEITPGVNQLELQIASNAQTSFWLYKLEVQQNT